MSGGRPNSWPGDLDHIADRKPFRIDRVISFKLYAQKQKILLGSMYTFLPQEQIYLKVKERWKKMENKLKQNYTKAVLRATHRQSPSKRSRKQALQFSPPRSNKKTWFKARGDLKCSLKDTAVELPPAKRISSRTKVADWLNDPKQKDLSNLPGRRRSYDCTRYNLPYNVPTVFDPTPCKQPGILKVSSSEKKGNVRSRTRVSFGGDEDKSPSDSKENVPPKTSRKPTKTKARERLKYTKINNIYSFEDQDPCEKPCNSETSDLSMKPLSESNAGNISDVDTAGSVTVRELLEDVLFTTPETEQMPLKEIVKAPRKRKSQATKNPASKLHYGNSNSTRSMKGLQAKNQNETDCGNTNNNNVVFGNKPWAATTYTRKAGVSRSTRTREDDKGKIRGEAKGKYESQRKASVDSMPDVNDELESDENNGNFIRGKRGLLVGPIIRNFNEEVDFHDTQSDVSLENFDAKGLDSSDNEGPKVEKPCNSKPRKKLKKCTNAFRKQDLKKTSGRKISKISKISHFKKSNKISTSNKDRYSCDFGDDDDDDDDNDNDKDNDDDEVCKSHLEEAVNNRPVRSARQSGKCNRKKIKSNVNSNRKNAPKQHTNTSPSNDCDDDNLQKENQKDKTQVKSKILKSKSKEALLNKGGKKIPSKQTPCRQKSPKYVASISSPSTHSMSIRSPSILSLSVRSPMKNRVSALCKKLTPAEPISPVISTPGKLRSDSGSDGESMSAFSGPTGTNPALLRALLRMKQVTSPNLFSMNEVSPKLLSPTLSGISELSSMPSASPMDKGFGIREERLVFDTEEPMVEIMVPSDSQPSQRYTRSSKSKAGNNTLCSMFQSVSPQERRVSRSGRRLVSSNKRQGSSNFENLFEEQDIFV